MVKIKILLLTCLLLSNLYGNWKTKRETLDKVYLLNDFRIFYTLKGKHAIKDKSDVNQNSIPDIVENVALQFDVANRLFKDIFKFKSPLEQKKYQVKNTKFFDVHFLKIKGNGSAGDGSIFYDYKILKNRFNALSISISNKIKVGNLTPAHELFHSYQYGSTMFKNRWYLEGTARWSERIFQLGTGKQKRLPSTAKDIQRLLNRTYDAKYFWNRLVRLTTQQKKQFNLPKEFEKLTYIGSSKRIVQDDEIYGIDFMKLFLENMHEFDQLVAQKNGYDPLSWRESKQKAFSNNPYILMAIKQTISDLKPKPNDEVAQFLKATDEYLKKSKQLSNIPDLSKKLQSLGIAYQSFYDDDTEHVYSRNVWDMKVYNNRLYIGAGNGSNSQPSANAGPLPIISYDFKTQTMIEEFIVDDEAIDLFRVLDNKLFIPGADATQSHKYGNFYMKDGIWEKFRTLPNTLHVFDMTYFDNRLFAAISTSKGAAVAISDDMGKNWKVQQLGKYQRSFAFLELNNKLYVMKQIWHDKKIKEMTAKLNEDYFFIAQYENGAFVPRTKIIKKDIFPYNKLRLNKTVRISKRENLNNQVIYMGAYYYDNPFAFFVANSFDAEKEVKLLEISDLLKPKDITVDNGKAYLLASKRDYKKFESIVYEFNPNDNSVKALFRITTKALIRSFDVEKNDFYFGLGSDVRNKKRWKQKELHPHTGKILKLEYRGQ